MIDTFSLTCPSCGGKLQVSKDLDRFACGYCGNELIVRRSGGVVSIAPVIDSLKEVKVGVDKTASELAIVRLKNEIQNLAQQRDEILEKYPSKTKMNILVPFTFLVGLAAIVSSAIEIGAVILVLGIVLLYLASISDRGRTRLLKKEISPVLNALDEKKAALAKHQQLVDQD